MAKATLAIAVVWAALMVVTATVIGVVEANLGVNWGTMASHPLNPNIVVNLLKDNGIKKVKLFDSDSWTVSALAGSKIETIVAIPNDQLESLASDYNLAKDWVKENITTHIYEGGVDIRYVAVGNEPFLTAFNGSYVKLTFPAMENIQKALNEAGHGKKIKTTTPLNADVYESASNQPSDGQFRSDIHDTIKEIVNFLSHNDAPFMVNIYPFLSLYQNPDFPVDFAFLDEIGKSINDKGKTYTNVFDANYDTLVWSLKKIGAGNLKIIVGEVGWPTEANKFANVELAKRFYDGLFKKLASKKGTPMRPNEKLEVYLFGLFDEDMKSILPGFFERHWGIFRYDGKPKFPMDFTGKGNDEMPVAAKGVQYLEHKWCVVKNSVKDLRTIASQIDYACSMSDCTSLVYGSSCNNLNPRGNVSFAYNMYFQMQDQSVEACVFDGSAEIVTKNASVGNCLFPIQIVSTGQRLTTMNIADFVATVLVALVLNMYV
ncbi:glucan endo-1,3-beta-glucosidase 8-like [Benincasa hispida]|uniref:glucan endo-1,3-beta-glucosidase 8-like n=1 Tax=Benincasa hispida TaxID=102211 RepID=UPI001902BB46|nr:glucan endo-1,3-beta-glucosidase 8-like [Benincasa hispida]